jgi:hypothetical protein
MLNQVMHPLPICGVYEKFYVTQFDSPHLGVVLLSLGGRRTKGINMGVCCW